MPCAWYLRYSLSLRDVEELFAERGMEAHHTSIWRWVQCYGPELEQRLRRQLKPTNKSWRVDETYIRVKGRWCYLYRAALKKGRMLQRFGNPDDPNSRSPQAQTIKRQLQRHPFSVGEPEGIARIALFLASNEARMIPRRFRRIRP